MFLHYFDIEWAGSRDDLVVEIGKTLKRGCKSGYKWGRRPALGGFAELFSVAPRGRGEFRVYRGSYITQNEWNSLLKWGGQ